MQDSPGRTIEKEKKHRAGGAGMEETMDNIVFGAVLIAVGALEAIRPKELWKFAPGGRKRHTEPTQRELLISRIGGMALVLVGAACFFL